MALTAATLKSQAEAGRARAARRQAAPASSSSFGPRAGAVGAITTTGSAVVLTIDLEMKIAAGPSEPYEHYRWVQAVEQAEVIVKGLFPGFQRSWAV